MNASRSRRMIEEEEEKEGEVRRRSERQGEA